MKKIIYTGELNDWTHEWNVPCPQCLGWCKSSSEDDRTNKTCVAKNIFGSQVILNSINAGTYQNTLKPLEDSKAISKSMATKIARSGLNYEHLKVAFERNGFDGLMGVLGEKVEGTVWVTKQSKIVQKIFDHFSQL